MGTEKLCARMREVRKSGMEQQNKEMRKTKR